MRFHRAINVLTLFALLPAVVGCSKTRIIGVNLGDAARYDRFHRGRTAIVGYEDRNGAYHEWEGCVWAAGPDSLAFSRCSGRKQQGPLRVNTSVLASDEEPGVMRVARRDVMLVKIREPAEGRTLAMQIGLTVLLLAALVGAAALDELLEL